MPIRGGLTAQAILGRLEIEVRLSISDANKFQTSTLIFSLNRKLDKILAPLTARTRRSEPEVQRK